MKVSISTAYFNDSANFDELDQLRRFFETGRHFWAISDFDGLEGSGWMDDSGRSGLRAQEIYKKYVTLGGYPDQSRLHRILLVVSDPPVSIDHLTLEQALECLSAPALVAVENETSDGGFLRAMQAAYSRSELNQAFASGWWRLYHLGGFGEVEKCLRDKVLPGPCRTLVLADSDALSPGHVTRTRKKVEEACQSLKISCFILSKRKIENYLPLDYLPDTSVKKAFLRLNNQQQSHYEMKHGFKRSENGEVEIPLEQRGLFADPNAQNVKEQLIGGFGGQLSLKFSENITSLEMEAICPSDPTEIPRLLDQIEALL